MADMINVNVKELIKCSQRIQKHLEGFNSQVSDLYNDFSRLNQGWKSSENQEFINNMNDYIGDLKKLGEEVSAYAAFLQTAADKYDDKLTDGLRIATSFDRG